MEYIKLKDISVQIKDGDWIESKDQSSEGIRLIQTGNIGEGRYIDKIDKAKFISDETFENLKCTEIFENDILISRLPSPVGRACLVPQIDVRAITAVDCTILKIDESKCLPKYFIYYSMSERYKKQIEKFVVGSTRVRISRKNLETIEVGVPSIEKQEKIVEVLDKAQSLIDKKKEQIELLDELVKSRFIEMFGKLHINDKNWNKGVISDYCKVKGGKRVPKGEKLLDEKTDHPYLRVIDLKKGTVLEEDIKYISDEIYEKIKRYIISSDDVYLTNVGEKLGMAGTIPKKFNNANLTENAVKLVFDNNLINKTYLAYYLNSDVCQNYILERKMTVGVPKLAIFRIESLPLIIPPIELQNEFAEFVAQTDSIRSKMEASLSELEDNFNSLMQKAFKGELF